ncbi:alpha/beta fold hydrolase [Streptomyces sp. NPDC058092]|uniref:alpha/beta fold hydrolase n=1 Tax=Streptomyces sp. NPDC058092 TaxID=3346336 RepID=UPI0036F02FF5
MGTPELLALSDLDTTEAPRQGVDSAPTGLSCHSPPLPDPLGTISVPTVFLHGDADGNVPIEVTRWAHAQIDGAELDTAPDGGHSSIR